MRFRSSVLLLCILTALSAVSCKKADLGSDKAKVSYGMGLRFAEDMKNRGIELDMKAFNQAVEDVSQGRENRLTDEELQTAFMNFSQAVMKKQNDRAEENLKSGEEYLKKNSTAEGVVVTKSGLQYRVLRQGTGISPKPTDTVTVHYSGRLLDGTEFDSSYKRNQPAQFQLNQVIPGWAEGVQLMKTGSKYELTVPAVLGYGAQGAQGIPGNSVLIFEVELLDVKKK